MSTLFVNNLNTASGTTITIPTGKQLIGTDTNSIKAPGMVVQVQHKAVPNASRTGNTTSTSYVATGEYVDFTPKYTNSIIYITLSIGMQFTNTSTGAAITNIGRDGTMLGTGNYPIFMRDQTTSAYTPVGGTFVDTPSTTSAVRYEVYIKSSDGNQVFAIHEQCYFSLVVMEVAQ